MTRRGPLLGIQLRKARWGWYAYLVNEKGVTVRRTWRPTKYWAFGEADAYRADYVGTA